MSSSPASFAGWFRGTGAPYVVHACASLAVLLVGVWLARYRGGLATQGELVFNFHPLCMVLAFVLVIPEAAILFRTSGFSRRVNQPAHVALQLAALVLVVLGLLAVIKFQRDHGFAHLKTLHAWMGATTVTLFCAQFALGAVTYYGVSGSWRAQLGPAHAFLGAAVLAFSTVTVCMGLLEDLTFAQVCSPVMRTECRVANAAGLFAVLSSFMAGFIISPERFARGEASANAASTDGNDDENTTSGGSETRPLLGSAIVT